MENANNDTALHANTYDEMHKRIQSVTWIGAGINIVLACGKIIAGIVGNSQAVIADGVHSLSDLITDAAILIGSQYWSQPADEKHPHGHRRIETLVTIGVGLALALVGVGLGWEAIVDLQDAGAKEKVVPGWIAVAAAAASIVIKEILFRWTAAVGRAAKSPAVVANAWHHRTDVFSSIPVLIAVLATRIFPSWSILDKIGAMIVSVFIIQAAIGILKPALQELADTAAPPEDRQRILEIAESVPEVLCVHKIRTRQLGSGIEVDLHLLVQGSMTVQDGHDVAELAKNRILEQGPGVIDVIIHLEPYPCGGYQDCPQRPPQA